jgi:LPS sulfotransferase NodH
MIEALKECFARYIAYPLPGMTVGVWWSLLREHRFDVDWTQSVRAVIESAISVLNSIGARTEQWRYCSRVEAARPERPLFILGHYRSGTTHLHNLLALDGGVAAPTFFQVLNPHTFLSTEKVAAPIVDRLLVRRRYQDEMPLSAGVPGEDEFATCTMTGLSPYMGWCFPGDGARYDRYLTFRDVPSEETSRWERALTTFLKKLTVRYGRPLVLKSPPHTARIGRLLSLFPDARFVHIHRNPYVVYRSTRHMIRAAQPLYQLRSAPPQDSEDRILSVYKTMYDAFFDERTLVPDRRLCEISYEDLDRAPIDAVASIYQTLALPGFEELLPRLEGYLETIAGYHKNRHEDLSHALRARIASEWGRSFDAWGYDR